MGRHKGWKLTAAAAVMLLMFYGYTSKIALFTGDSYVTATADAGQAAAAALNAATVETAATGKPTNRTASDHSTSDRATAEHAGADRAAVTTTSSPGGSNQAAGTSADRQTNAHAAHATPDDKGTGGSAKSKPDSKAKRVALTFDDGPDRKYTPLILDVLKKNEVKATFFVVGVQVSKFGDVLERIVKEGHAVGNHSWDHADLTKKTPEQIDEEIGKTDEAIRKAIGSGTDLFRPPYGANDTNVKKAAASAERKLVLWTVDTRDWSGSTPKEILEKIRKQTKPGGIILMHSFGGKGGKLDNTVEALPQVIDYLKSEGYTFVTVPELLAGQAAN